MTTQIFIDALSCIKFTHTHGSTEHISLRSDDGFEVSYSVRIAVFSRDLPLQMVLHLKYDGAHVMSQGAETEADNKLFVQWYNQARGHAKRSETGAEKDAVKVGYSKFMDHVESVDKR